LERRRIKASKRTTIKLWNASRFCFAHLKNFENKKAKIITDEDKWILSLLERALKDYCSSFDNYEFKKSREIVDNFFWHNFCDNYLEIIKPRLYQEDTHCHREPEGRGDLGRSPQQYHGIASFTLAMTKETNIASKQSAQKTLYLVLLSVLKMYSPFMPFITEKLFQMYFKGREKEKSIHLSLLPKPSKKYSDKKVVKDFDLVVEIISAIRKYKSSKGLSLKQEINQLCIDTENKNIQKYFNLLKSVMNIKEIEFCGIKNGGLKIEKNAKIKFC